MASTLHRAGFETSILCLRLMLKHGPQSDGFSKYPKTSDYILIFREFNELLEVFGYLLKPCDCDPCCSISPACMTNTQTIGMAELIYIILQSPDVSDRLQMKNNEMNNSEKRKERNKTNTNTWLNN
ncbi:hypothetical protein BpHYR1_011825 [Brachionus plicatilis]|uniref:Uncharacterized protein n=1 Tax=Brachionus plicatilis TaxID=10195 RepID=A0A3M7RWQ7_BRAPC|nr:hypothetical protein BpHYR1_011825 [Brachionus plicatilis]